MAKWCPRNTQNDAKAAQITVSYATRFLYDPDMDHSAGFLKLVNEAKARVKEISIADAKSRLAENPKAVLIDVREDHEWQNGHATEAVHLGRGILERDLEKLYPDAGTELILYCGGGFRSALSAESAQKMGYRNVYSLQGGYKGMVAAGWLMKKGDNQ
jgi:rhodanese-related sulfurtransferase